MAVVSIPQTERTIRDAQELKQFLTSINIDYERWEPAHTVAADAPAAEILAAYAPEIERLKASGGYVTADVIDVSPLTPGLEAMLAKFKREHWHDDDEVRFIIEGRGLFHIHPNDAPVVAIEVEAGDLIRVPQGTLHWFNLCGEQRIRAIRLFKDPAGWSPNYTDSGTDDAYQPLCFGASYLPTGATATIPAV
jgi:1,2-dihydroxy-3-keto-5-methylthiopentene dioxygenase